MLQKITNLPLVHQLEKITNLIYDTNIKILRMKNKCSRYLQQSRKMISS